MFYFLQLVYEIILPKVRKSFQAIVKGRHELPQVTAGLKGLRLLKTTKSKFVNFVNDAYRVLPDAEDRIFSTVVEANWTYRSLNGLNFCKAFGEVERSLIENFAGPSSTGQLSPSVQQTLYEAQVKFWHRASSYYSLFLGFYI